VVEKVGEMHENAFMRTTLDLPDHLLLSERHFGHWREAANFRPSLRTDAWIAAIARSANARVVSFVADYSAFDGLPILRLDP